MEHNNVIELNGKRYDAATGQYLGPSRTRPVPVLPQADGKKIDGVVRGRVNTPAVNPLHSAAAAGKPVRRHRPQTAHPHRPQHASTLMRHVVRKPEAKLKPKIKPQSAAEIAAAPAATLAPKKICRSG